MNYHEIMDLASIGHNYENFSHVDPETFLAL